MKPSCTKAHFSFPFPRLSVQPAAFIQAATFQGALSKSQRVPQANKLLQASGPYGHSKDQLLLEFSSWPLDPFITLAHYLSQPCSLHFPAPATPAWCLNENAGQGVIRGQIRGNFLKAVGTKRRRLLCLVRGQGRLLKVTGLPSRGIRC